jgi:hypothetical protein
MASESDLENPLSAIATERRNKQSHIQISVDPRHSIVSETLVPIFRVGGGMVVVKFSGH